MLMPSDIECETIVGRQFIFILPSIESHGLPYTDLLAASGNKEPQYH